MGSSIDTIVLHNQCSRIQSNRLPRLMLTKTGEFNIIMASRTLNSIFSPSIKHLLHDVNWCLEQKQ